MVTFSHTTSISGQPVKLESRRYIELYISLHSFYVIKTDFHAILGCENCNFRRRLEKIQARIIKHNDAGGNSSPWTPDRWKQYECNEEASGGCFSLMLVFCEHLQEPGRKAEAPQGMAEWHSRSKTITGTQGYLFYSNHS